jgi:hypothetical protein
VVKIQLPQNKGSVAGSCKHDFQPLGYIKSRTSWSGEEVSDSHGFWSIELINIIHLID